MITISQLLLGFALFLMVFITLIWRMFVAQNKQLSEDHKKSAYENFIEKSLIVNAFMVNDGPSDGIDNLIIDDLAINTMNLTFTTESTYMGGKFK